MRKIWLLFPLILASRANAFQIVDINSATYEQIALLPGVGEKLAKELVAFREKHGAFKGLHGLKDIPGISAKKIAAFANKISFSESRASGKKPIQLIELPLKPLIDITTLEVKVLALSGLDETFDKSINHRARIAAWLPKLTAYVDTDHQKINTDMLKDSRDSMLRRKGKDIGLGLRMIFDLDKLIFNTDELEIAKLFLKRLEKREEIILKLHKNYFRYVALRESIKKPLDPILAESISLEMQEIEALLDFMSGGEIKKYQLLNKNEEYP